MKTIKQQSSGYSERMEFGMTPKERELMRQYKRLKDKGAFVSLEEV